MPAHARALLPSNCLAACLPALPPHLSAYPTTSVRAEFGRGDDTVGNPHRTQICKFELFELVLLLKLVKQFTVEQFEATVSQSTVPSPPLIKAKRALHGVGSEG